jgi:DNA-binding transcriptional LysR family regulator
VKLPAGFDLHAIEIFMLTAELGGMTQSAQHLGLTQSAVSQMIAKLEASLGTVLFDRKIRPLALTDSGAALFESGAGLIASAKNIVSEVRDGSQLPRERVTIAMSESLANHLTSPILAQLGNTVAHWCIRSGISQDQHQDFLARKIDMLVTGSSTLEQVEGFDHHLIFQERFLIVMPANFDGIIDPVEPLGNEPFIRYSLQSGMGQRIERQLARMKWRPAKFVEIDSTQQQLSAVADGLGWSITTPLCVAGHENLLPKLHLKPMTRAHFNRAVQVVSRRDDLGDLPLTITRLAQKVFREETFGALLAAYPWIETHLEWTI